MNGKINNIRYIIANSQTPFVGKTIGANGSGTVSCSINIPSGYILQWNISAQCSGSAGLACVVDTGQTSTQPTIFYQSVFDHSITTGTGTIILVTSLFKSS